MLNRISFPGGCLRVRIGFGVCEELLVTPPAAEGFDEMSGGDEALAAELGAGALGLERFSAGVHDLEV